MDELLQTLRPVLGLENAEERDDVLPRRISNHDRRIAERLEDGRLDERRDIGRGAQDETGIILEKVAGNGANPVILLGHGREDEGEVGDVVGRAREVVQFLANEGEMKRRGA